MTVEVKDKVISTSFLKMGGRGSFIGEKDRRERVVSRTGR